MATPNVHRVYYAAGGQRIALRANGTLYYLLTDHLGSTTLLVDTAGTVVSGLGYLPYGQQRYTRGAALPTELKFTGQREEAMLGLYDYGARWYDPALGRFLTPDTLIPDPGNPADWDRFAYVRGNPVKYTDPTGYKACESDEDCHNSPTRKLIGKSDYQKWLREFFGWTTTSDFSTKELKKIYETGWQIRTYASNQTSGQGKEWMDKYIGDAKFFHNPASNGPYPINGNAVPTGNLVFLNSNWINDPRGPASLLTHELGHVVDNMSSPSGLAVWGGSGWGDDLANFAGGNPSGIRWINGAGSIHSENQWSDQTEWSIYGNNSSADYFAHAFAYAVHNPQAAPTVAQIWLNVRVSHSLP